MNAVPFSAQVTDQPRVAPARPVIVPPLGIWTCDRATSQSIVSQLQIQSSLCKNVVDHLIIFPWPLMGVKALSLSSRGTGETLWKGIFLPDSDVLCSVGPCGKQYGSCNLDCFSRVSSGVQATSPVSASCRTDGFFSIQLLQHLVASIIQERPNFPWRYCCRDGFVRRDPRECNPRTLKADFQHILPLQHHSDISTIPVNPAPQSLDLQVWILALRRGMGVGTCTSDAIPQP